MKQHIPVLLHQVLDGLNLRRGAVIVDGTLNGGGHAREIIRRIMPGGIFVGIELDGQLLARTEKVLKKEFFQFQSEIFCLHGNYRDVDKLISLCGLKKLDGIFLDLGFSSLQLESKRGFSFLKNEPLDMRYDSERGKTRAVEVVNFLGEKELANIFTLYGEESFAKKIAKAIVQYRRREMIITTFQLVNVIKKAIGKLSFRRRIHPATQVFQALRIFVNKELDNLAVFLKKFDVLMRSGGRVAIISFHSLEDRLVKRRFLELARSKKALLVTKKPIQPSWLERKSNPRSRSAKLRVLEII